MIPYIKFQTKDSSDSVISGIDAEGNIKSILGPISDSIIENSINGNIVLIFSQGDLQLTPLISSLFIESESDGDVIIGIPTNKYDALNKIYYNNFFSLTKGDTNFIYKDALWCSIRKKKEDNNKAAENDDDKTTFMLNGVQTKPKYGKLRYKKDIENSLTEELNDGSINKKRFILTFRLDTGFENLGLDNTSLFVEHEDYKLRPIEPKLIILESVNDTMYNLNPIIPFINYLIKNRIGAVIHFSWPYVNGLWNLFQSIDKLEEREKVKIFHLGKRFSFEIKDFVRNSILKSTDSNSLQQALQEHPALKQFSLEGKKWEDYYPLNTHKLENVAFCSPIDSIINIDNLKDFLTTPSEIDIRIEKTKEELNGYGLPRNLYNILKFMPFIDSFVPPTSLKYSNMAMDGTYSKRDILTIISDSKKKIKGDGIYDLNSKADIIRSMSETLNLSDYIHDIKTPIVNTKYSIIVSFLLKSFFEVNNMNIIICDYNPKFGFRSYMSEYISMLFTYIQKHLPFSYDKLPKNDFILFSSLNNLIEAKLEGSEIIKFDFEQKNPSKFIVTLYTNFNNTRYSEKKITIDLESMQHLYNNINYYDYTKTILLLPGPLPIIRFDTEVPVLSEGIDLYLRPFYKIVIFVNPGRNYNKALEQVTTIESFLFGDKSNRIAKKDLEISYNLNNSLNEKIEPLFTLFNTTKESNVNQSDSNINIEDSLNDVITEEFLENEKNSNISDYKSLKEIWESISTKKEHTQPIVNSENPGDFLNILVRFEKTGIEEIISIRKGTYIRLIDNEEDELTLVEDIKPGERIAYMESESKDSLDNYLIKEYSGYLGVTLEEVLEPFKCLSIFYQTISNIKFSESYSIDKFMPLYWLNENERIELYEHIQYLTRSNNINISDAGNIRTHFKNSTVWNFVSELEDKTLIRFKNNFTHKIELNINDLYYVATCFGFKLEKVSFRPLLKDLSDNRNKYFFRDEKNLLAISLLIHYNKIIENYEDLTDAGKNILKLLQQIGKSLTRVISNKKKAYNEMDLLIEEKVMVCIVLGFRS